MKILSYVKFICLVESVTHCDGVVIPGWRVNTFDYKFTQGALIEQRLEFTIQKKIVNTCSTHNISFQTLRLSFAKTQINGLW